MCPDLNALHSTKGLGAVEQLRRFHSAVKFMSTANNPKMAKFGCASYPSSLLECEQCCSHYCMCTDACM